MSGPDDADNEDDVDELCTRIGSLEESLESLHDKLDDVLAWIDDREKTQQPTTINESN